MKLLLVDAHQYFRDGLSGILSAQPGITIVGAAKSVSEAVSQTRDLAPDVVLMDFTLPDGTGLDATRAILEDRPGTKIVFLTVHEDDERLFAAVRSGAQGYLPKNISINDLVSYLRGVERGDAAITSGLAVKIMVEFAQTVPDHKPSALADAHLTARELEVLQEMETGASNRQIADRLVISERTVQNHVSRILKKLNLRNRHEAAEFARQNSITGSLGNLE